MTDGPRPATAVAIILAGGRSRRMLGHDKGLVTVHGKRLIDLVIARLRPQAEQIAISGPHDYGTGLEWFPDCSGAPGGPAAGVFSACQWLTGRHPDANCFVTAPVDGPLLPRDLVERFRRAGVTAIASDGENDHPTFACWRLSDLAAAWPRLRTRPRLSLRALAEACGARRVIWRNGEAFFNINSPADLEAAQRLPREDPRIRDR